MDLNSSALWGIIGLIGGGIITYFFIKHPISKYKIIYKKETSCLLSNTEIQNSGISIQHDSCNIDNLYLSKVTIWNNGYYKITENDFVSNHTIKLLTDGQIFPYALHVNDPNSINEPNDIELKLKKNKQIDINIILLQPHTKFSFSFFHTDVVNYSGELKEGKIYEYHKKNYKYPIILFLLLFNLFLSFVYINISEVSSDSMIAIKILFDLFLMLIYSSFYNTPTEQ